MMSQFEPNNTTHTWGCAPKCVCVFFRVLLGRSHFDWPITNISFQTLGTPQYRGVSRLPFDFPFIVYICIKYESSTLGKAYRIKVCCHWEHIGLFKKGVGTWWELNDDKKRMLCPPKPKKPKKLALQNACQAFSLVVWKLWFENHLSPF
jgi:hypothetical protein